MGGQLPAAGDEVGVKVGLGGRGDAQAPLLGLGQIGAGVAARIHDQGAPVAQVHHVGAVAQPLVHQGDDLRPAHRPVPSATDSPARFHSGNPSTRRLAL